MDKIKTKIGVFALACLLMSSLAISPSLANISKSFPDASPSLIQMLLSIPGLANLVGALVVGKISTSISKKSLALTGIFLVIIGGIVPFFLHQSLYFLLLCSGILGLGVGALNTLTPSIIAENFYGEERGETMGQMTAFVSIGAVIVIYVGGMLAVKGWQYNYLAYIFAVILFVIALVTLPSKKIDYKEIKNELSKEKEVAEKIKLNKFVFLLGIVGFMFLMVYNAFPNNISLYISSENIGDVSTTGTASALAQIGGLISGLMFGKISKLSGKYTFSLAFLILGVGLLVTIFTQSPSIVLIGSFLSGFSLSIYMAQAPFTLSMIVDQVTFPMAIAVYSAMTSIATFVSPLVINFMARIIGNGDAKVALISGGIIAIVVSIIIVIVNFQDRCLRQSDNFKCVENGEVKCVL